MFDIFDVIFLSYIGYIIVLAYHGVKDIRIGNKLLRNTNRTESEEKAAKSFGQSMKFQAIFTAVMIIIIAVSFILGADISDGKIIEQDGYGGFFLIFVTLGAVIISAVICAFIERLTFGEAWHYYIKDYHKSERLARKSFWTSKNNIKGEE